MRNAYKILVEKPEGKKLLRRHRRKWEGNIGRDLKGIGWEVVDWIHLAEDMNPWWTPVNTIMNILAL
jgi:hypothetical protein